MTSGIVGRTVTERHTDAGAILKNLVSSTAIVTTNASLFRRKHHTGKRASGCVNPVGRSRGRRIGKTGIDHRIAESYANLSSIVSKESHMPAARVRAREHQRTIHTTLGELVEAISEVAFEYAPEPKEAYEIARLVLLKVMKESLARQIVNRRSVSRQ